MTTAQITYGKKITAIQQGTAGNVIKSMKASQLASYLCSLDSYAIRLNNTVLKKAVSLSVSLGFNVTIDESYGFEWESKIYCTK